MTSPVTAPLERLRALWLELYEGAHEVELEALVADLERFKAEHTLSPLPAEWYKDVVVYSLYVDHFGGSFEGVSERLDYLQGLGVSCLWLLPILESPMKDAGFDISDYSRVRADLSRSSDAQAAFDAFVAEAKSRGMSILFDIALNHSSEEHPWFQAARSGPDSPYREHYIWSDTPEHYREARIIFKGMMDSNWTRLGEQYYFHRFFDIQPDLNYRNPQVLAAMTLMLIGWLARGVDGVRADAIPYLWKEEGSNCENLPKTHTIVKIFRAAMDHARPGSILLAEANQPPLEVAKYFGDGDECLAAYHFPLMPRLYEALARADREPVVRVLGTDFTPSIPPNCQWFTFLRCHDELTLEMVSPEERRFLFEHYAREALWDFREGEGISARLADLMDNDPRRIALMNSVLLTLAGTPILYYGDELGRGNDRAYYDAQVAATGYADSRYLVRGPLDWRAAERDLADAGSLAAQVFYPLQRMILQRRNTLAFSRGRLEFLDLSDQRVLAYARIFGVQRVIVLANLSSEEVRFAAPAELGALPDSDLLERPLEHADGEMRLEPYGFHWLAA